MASTRPGVWLVAHPEAVVTELTDPLRATGFAVYVSLVTPAEPFALVVQLVDDTPDLAAAFARRLRADRTHSPKPLLWLVTEHTLASAAGGLEAGADACLVRPVDGELLAAQVQALLRTHENLHRFASKGADAHDLTERLQKAYRTLETDVTLARLLPAVLTPPSVRNARWWTQPTASGGASRFDVLALPNGELRWAMIDVGGVGPTSGALLAEAFKAELLRSVVSTGAAKAMDRLNQFVQQLQLPDSAVLSAAVGSWDSTTATVASAGLPPPVLFSSSGSCVVWHGSGPFLGTTTTSYGEVSGKLQTRDRLVMISGGAAVDRRPDLRESIIELADKPLEDVAEQLAKRLLSSTDEADGLTVFVLQQEAESR
jgi:AmiR/NasT family two-component response regulator